MEFRIGSEGNSVKSIQSKLNSIGFNVGTADGKFGQKTYEGIRQFQLSKKINATGIADQQTIDLLFANDSRSVSSTTNGGNMLTTYIEKIKSNKLYMGAAILGIAGLSFLAYKKVKK
jgi:peptidoglycan hydrolase-like protein with peptidoglycan-binding domain